MVGLLAGGRTVTPSMFSAAVDAAVRVVMPKVERLDRRDDLAATPADECAGYMLRDERLAEFPMRMVVASSLT